MANTYIEEKIIEPINILIVFLIGIATILFLIGSIQSFGIDGPLRLMLILTTGILYLIATVALLWPKKTRTPVRIEPKIIHRDVIREVEKPVLKYVKEPVFIKGDTIIEKKESPTKIALVEVEKEQKKKTKYVGSTYNEKYHLRTCRFAGVIKEQYLVEEDDRKFFELRGYSPCKICFPNKN